MMVATRLSSVPSFGPKGPGLALSRRDYRIQPGVLTPGGAQKTPRPERAVVSVSQAYADVVLKSCRSKISYAPSGLVVVWAYFLGLKPQAESCYPFGINPTNHFGTKTRYVMLRRTGGWRAKNKNPNDY